MVMGLVGKGYYLSDWFNLEFCQGFDCYTSIGFRGFLRTQAIWWVQVVMWPMAVSVPGQW